MKVYSINYAAPNCYTTDKSVKKADKSIYSYVTDLGYMQGYYTYIPNKVNFKGHTLNKLSVEELEKLKQKVLRQTGKTDIGEYIISKYKNDYGMQLIDYLLNHKIIENPSVRTCLGDLLKFSSTNWHKDNPYYTESVLKSMCEAQMDFADYIVEHPIYKSPEVYRIIGPSLCSISKENLEAHKILCNYLNDNPDKLNDRLAVWFALADGDFVRNTMYGEILKNPDKYKTAQVTKL